MEQTPKGLRLHIGLFGRRNTGKSSVLNAMTRQHVSIVSDTPGTTTDPVEKPMELLPLGPVVFLDTAGVDDVGALGEQRVLKTRGAAERTDLAILVTDDWQDWETRMLGDFRASGVPVIVAANKSDARGDDRVEAAARRAGAERVVSTTALRPGGVDTLRQAIIQAAPEDYMESRAIVADLVRPGDVVVLVVPIDLEAPKGRLILPQVQTMRDILDSNACALVLKVSELASGLERLKTPPTLVVTDSQAFKSVAALVPDSVPLTSFSILFARFKADLVTMVRGALAIDGLRPGDRVLVAEACAHHPIGEDIGRVKIPRWLSERAGGELRVDATQGRDLPDNLAEYKLIVHCGACLWNRRQMVSRMSRAESAGVPMTNYGLAIAHSLGILERAIRPFPQALDAYRKHRRGAAAHEGR